MRTCIACLMLLIPCSSVRGELVIFELGGNLNGSSVDGVASGSLTINGLTATLTANDGVLNATASNFGVNASGSGDVSDQLDAGSGVSEFITITFDAPVEFTQLSLATFSGNERASLSVGLNTPLLLAATAAGTDIYNFSSGDWALGNTLAVGQAVVVGYSFGSVADNGFSLAGFHVNTVPEPTSLLCLGWLLAGASFVRRLRGS